MPLTLPASPTVGQMYTSDTNNITYTWNGQRWSAIQPTTSAAFETGKAIAMAIVFG